MKAEGNAAFKAKKFKQAVKLYGAAIGLDPSNADNAAGIFQMLLSTARLPFSLDARGSQRAQSFRDSFYAFARTERGG